MRQTNRQRRMLDELQRAVQPLTGTELAERCGVTRQVVVHDVALLRAGGVEILATPRGYELRSPQTDPITILSVYHPPELTAAELFTFVDYGIQVEDVLVEHPVYGELRGGLHLASRRDVELFLERVSQSDALLLSSLTEGFHIHTVRSPSERRLSEAIVALRLNGIEVLDDLDEAHE